MDSQNKSESDQDMETVPTKIAMETAPMAKNGGRSKKKKNGGSSSNKPKANPKTDDTLLPITAI